jgi:hypothetical protein
MARLRTTWAGLGPEQRTVVVAAGVLLATMLLPWYSKSVDAVGNGRILSQSSTKLAITVFSWVEAAVFLVAAGVLVLVLARGQRRAFHLPGGDGTVVAAGGAWATFLIFYRFVDKPSGGGSTTFRVEYGLSWGIFFGLLAALALLASGLRLRAAHVREPALPGDVAPTDGPGGVAGPSAASTAAERRREREARRADRPRPSRDAAATTVDPRGAATGSSRMRTEPAAPAGSASGESPAREQTSPADGQSPRRARTAGTRRALPGPAADAPVRQARERRD